MRAARLGKPPSWGAGGAQEGKAARGVTAAASQCQRYDLIEQSSTDHTIATCDNGLGDKPLFVAQQVPAKEQVQA